ncbi:hypothetical protein PN498_12680 [Oscillatoria sp. CS-180]|uniref:hypothetical protein n=1 Tax=Oscillatoria sp. CS-180 TaxID=3021720 RepID=UPI00232DF69F|nr:hypothetical protein [Oscillatoria sp. CS-180]MDB9526847.1 hypothetical protein [Oscillatoria sp. CS-180]
MTSSQLWGSATDQKWDGMHDASESSPLHNTAPHLKAETFIPFKANAETND